VWQTLATTTLLSCAILLFTRGTASKAEHTSNSVAEHHDHGTDVCLQSAADPN